MPTVHDLETPSVLIDLDRMEANIATMQARCDALGIQFRAHIKTHKIPAIARQQLDAGAVGIACQKVSEAEVFAAEGFHDIQLPYNILGERKTARLADLAIANKITVSADSEAVIAGLQAAAADKDVTIRVMVDLETDAHRTGVTPDRVVALAQQVEAAPNLHFAGLLVYPSNPTVRDDLQDALRRLHEAGIGVDSVSGGGTGAALVADQMPEVTELRVGTYLFNDWTSVKKGWATLDDCAMHVTTTVVSRPTENRAILDAGSKTLSQEFDDGYGYIVEYPNARIYKLNEEHGHVDLSACEHKPDVGEIVHVVPVHTCVVTNLHNQIYGVRGDEIEVVWPVAARGLVW